MFRSLAKAVLRTLTRVLFRIDVEGTLPPQPERLLVIANHESFLDGLLLGLYLPMNPVFVVHTTVAKSRWFRLILSLVDYLAVDPTSPMAMKKVVRLLESGRPVVIFPEGRITTTGSLMKTYDGPAFVAARTGASILPIRLEGAARTWFSRVSGKAPKRLFPKIRLAIQPLTRIAMPEAPTARERRRKAGEAMRRVMQEMVFASRPRQTLFEALLDTAAIHGRGRRLVEDLKQEEYSYGDLLKMSLALGRLVARETAQGENVGILLPNLAPTLALVVGLPAFGRTPAMLNYTAGVDGMQAACTAAEVVTVLTSRAFVEQARLGDKLASLQGIRLIYLEDLRAAMTLSDKLWLMLWAMPFPYAATRIGSAEDPAVVLFTSGSEGKPKGVVLSHRALLANIAQIRAVVDFSVDDKILNALPLFHSFGLTAGGLLPLFSGANVFLYPSPLHYRVIPELAYDRGCSVLLGTSTFLANYAKHAHPYDFYRLRYVIAGAEKLAEPVRELWFEKFGIRIFEGYGATETAPVMAVNTPMAFRRGTVGQFLPGVQARLEPVPGIARGGMLHVSGPNLMSGYLRFDRPGVLQPPASSAGTGWYETGDVVEVDDDGFVRIVGRVKRFAKIAGEMVSLEVVEKIAAAAAPAAQHAASTQTDAAKGEALVLFSTDPALAREALVSAARVQGASELAVPRKIVTVDALPLLGTGKIDYVTLKQWAEAA
ncbi:bifunctional acyl-ACP--phospholipid O-acyltransferase/long-chain-fatty-acid--ACP ligase [Cognatazoarcus halotolerans]|uniref:bifunctional acyl-ACP--phospholipid O-acyltransferase/long-chain-fatty-acid--ACP ligase n=1 Tax=Cognatazoarcus halotolerans TaxID=2686016 RepID=UPI00135AD8D4|nr:bifunctional acyl-ACP--phospholipid O-acyltransferase/long-chain-fatty-acid--ACP ligase [Cognatazoarcus halotolerans]MCB1898553.1 bifunctional acyl-ACP--phospholipid O-acyltransferase/long-chain-fatty-acid--ACP ligase [Rhodocyclaceae bacterium]MCP5310204.1 bifunctional acyl-ACP--phospholipid O-acyltransferase/long-chain-fatty-acid--ACP ligase [Zoogloeaceae bacterium]